MYHRVEGEEKCECKENRRDRDKKSLKEKATFKNANGLYSEKIKMAKVTSLYLDRFSGRGRASGLPRHGAFSS
jgi:hypothetical protein